MRHRRHFRQQFVEAKQLLREYALLPVNVWAACEVACAVARACQRAAADRVDEPHLAHALVVFNANANAHVRTVGGKLKKLPGGVNAGVAGFLKRLAN